MGRLDELMRNEGLAWRFWVKRSSRVLVGFEIGV
jgi:hypothetical protein